MKGDESRVTRQKLPITWPLRAHQHHTKKTTAPPIIINSTLEEKPKPPKKTMETFISSLVCKTAETTTLYKIN
jgi:hypothetical protein